MNQNTIIGLLVAVIVLGGGYLLIKNHSGQPAANQASTSTTNSADQTPASAVPAAALTPGAPLVETSANTGTSNSTAIVTGQVNPNGAATAYWFDYGETTAFGTESTVQAVGSGYTLISTPAYITGLKANTLYYFRLNAKNSFATVNGATYSFQTNGNPPPQGFMPTGETNNATNVSRTTANLNGQVNPNGSPTTYWFEYGKNINLGDVTALESIGSGTSASPVSMPVSDLDPLTTYYFRLNAQNQYGTENGAVMSFTTTGPAAPEQPSVSTTGSTNVTASGVQLTGRINPNGAQTTYWFQYGSDSLLANLIGSGTTPQTLSEGTSTMRVQANVSGLQPNTTYFYRLVGSNSYGTVYGNIVSVKTRP